jgi:hypothetical protein
LTEIDRIGDLKIWIEQEQSICIKAIDKHGDPAELSVDEAEQLLHVLQVMISTLRAAD